MKLLKLFLSILPVFLFLTSCGGAIANPNFSQMTSLPPTEEGFTANYYEKNAFSFGALFTWHYINDNYYWFSNYYNSGYVIEDYVGDEQDIVIPDLLEIDGRKAPVIAIGHRAFYGRTNIRSVTLSDSVLYICDNAFSFSGVERLNATPHLIYISDSAFENAHVVFSLDEETNIEYLPTVDFPYGYAYRFKDEKMIGTTLKEGCLGINSGLFLNRTKTVTIPSSIVNFGELNFGPGFATVQTEATSLKLDCDIPSSFLSNECPSLTSIEIGSRCSSIGQEAFYGCDNITFAYISKSVTKMGRFIFSPKVTCTLLLEATEPSPDWAYNWLNPNSTVNIVWGASSPVIEEDGQF